MKLRDFITQNRIKTAIAVAVIFLLGVIIGTAASANTCDRDCTVDGKRAVKAGQTFTGYAHSNGFDIISFTTPSKAKGWKVLGSPTCGLNPPKTAIACVNYSGPVAFQAQTPEKAGVEGILTISTQPNKLYLTVDYMTEGEVQNAYWYYDTGLCNPALFSVAKGSPGHIVEAKYVCTNDPNYRG